MPKLSKFILTDKNDHNATNERVTKMTIMIKMTMITVAVLQYAFVFEEWAVAKELQKWYILHNLFP